MEHITLEKFIKKNTEEILNTSKWECAYGVKLSLCSVKRHLLTDKHILGIKARKYDELIKKLNLPSTNT